MSLRTKLHPMGGGTGKDKNTQVACSEYTTWYLNKSGDLYGCGAGTYGQQSNGSTSNVTTFTQRVSDIKDFACSQNTTWYLTTSGDLYGCGADNNGQQSSGSAGSSAAAVSTFTKRASDVANIACSNETTWYVTKSGDLYGCGDGRYGQQGNGYSSDVTRFTQRASGVASVACTNETTWYIDNNGKLYSCGRNSFGAQGSGDTSGSNVTRFTQRASGVAKVACNTSTTWYLTTSGDLYGSGTGKNGQQGNGDASYNATVWTFTKRASGVKDFACSQNTTWYVTKSGDLYGCGWNEYGQQSSGSAGSSAAVSTFTKRASGVANIACNSRTTWYLTTSGDLYGCGDSYYGQQGNGRQGSGEYVTRFTKRASDVASVACSERTTWYVTKSGDLYGCGNSGNGQQGSGGTTNVTTFTKRN